jgi:mRNA interferase MazF
VTCAPIYSRWDEISTQVPVGTESGIKHDSAIHCDSLISLPKSMLNNYLGTLSDAMISELNTALKIALDVET